MEESKEFIAWKKNIVNLNKKYCLDYIELIAKRNTEVMKDLISNKEQHLLSSKEVRLVFFLKYIYPVAVSENNESKLKLLLDVGVGKRTSKYFINIKEVIGKLEDLEKTTKFIFNFQEILTYFEFYCSMFFTKKVSMSLSGSNLIKEAATKLQRKERDREKANKPEEESEFNSAMKTVKSYFDELFIAMEVDSRKDNVYSNMMRNINYPYKIFYKALYQFMYTANKTYHPHNKFNQTDFKVFFYDLLEIIIINKDLLNDNHEESGVHPTIREFKKKRVTSLLGV